MKRLILSLIPLVTLVVMVALSIILFGSDALGGANQISLLCATAVCVCIAMGAWKVKWKVIEEAMERTIGTSSVSIVILLMIGMMSGAWMVSGVVPTLIYYGIQVMSPSVFLVSTCLICAVVSVMTGSSWTTVATIGIALLGIGEALDIDHAWTAGAIISGSYFGDKISPLSDTTVLASSSARVNIFEHIHYMLFTTIPTFSIALIIFFIAGLMLGNGGEANTEAYTEGLAHSFNLSLWTLLVPLFTAILIARKVPALITLFLSAITAGIFAVILQPEIVATIANGAAEAGGGVIDADASTTAARAATTVTGASTTALSMLKGVMITFFTSTAIDTGNASLNDLVSTGGMQGMLDTVWLILCAMCFGGAMTATGMLQCITNQIVKMVRGRTSLVSCTALTGLSLNTMTSDQYMSIVLTGDMYRDVYKRMGFEGRLLSRTTEDSTTVTSVLIPWNTCGMTQSTILGVATLDYLPYCFFNYLSPLMTIFMSFLTRLKK